MGDWPSLDFIGHLLGDHQAAAGGIQLISCMHYDVVEDIPLLTAAVQRYGGQIYDLSAPIADWTDPPGPIDAGRLGVVEGIVATVPDALPGTVRFVATADGVVATVDDLGAATSPSLQLLLRAAAVMVSDALDRASITVVVASAVDADASRKELLWRLINPDPQILNLHADRTIVTVLSGNPDPDLDYGRPQPLRYVALADRILKRVEQPALSALRTIKQHEGPIVLFLGAGASASAGISLGNTWRDAALSDLMGGRGDHESLPEAFFQYLQDRDRFLSGERADRAGFLTSLTLVSRVVSS